MRYVDTLGRIFTPGVTAEVPTGKLLWVDSVYGNDDLAVRERLTVPFKTLASAKSVAQSEDTIVVMPGTYDERDMAKDGVNWHFLPGALIEYTGSAGAIFDTTGLGGVSFNITGHGVFKTTHTTPMGFVKSAHNDDVVHVKFDSVNVKGTGVEITAASSDIQVEGRELISIDEDGISVEGGATVKLDIRDIRSDGGKGLVLDHGSCNVEVRAFRIACGGTYAIHFKQANWAFIEAIEVIADSDIGIYYDSYGSDPLHLHVVRVVGTGTGKNAVWIEQGTGKLYLYRCTLMNSDSNTNSIDAQSATSVMLVGDSMLRRGAGTNVSGNGGSFLNNSLFE